MRTETLWQGQRRAERNHWWRQVLERPSAAANWAEVLDEMVMQRFGIGEDAPGVATDGAWQEAWV
jgi:hypothetical protein